MLVGVEEQIPKVAPTGLLIEKEGGPVTARHQSLSGQYKKLPEGLEHIHIYKYSVTLSRSSPIHVRVLELVWNGERNEIHTATQ